MRSLIDDTSVFDLVFFFGLPLEIHIEQWTHIIIVIEATRHEHQPDKKKKYLRIEMQTTGEKETIHRFWLSAPFDLKTYSAHTHTQVVAVSSTMSSCFSSGNRYVRFKTNRDNVSEKTLVRLTTCQRGSTAGETAEYGYRNCDVLHSTQWASSTKWKKTHISLFTWASFFS